MSDFTPLHIKMSTAEEYWVKESRKNFSQFVTYITGAQRPLATHHLEWAYRILSPEHKKVLIVAPRGSGKSDTSILIMAWFIGKYPHLTNFIGSVSLSQAKKRLSAIRDLIEKNERYKNVFPWIQIDARKPNNSEEMTIWSSKWRGKEIPYSSWRNIVATQGEPKDPTLRAGSNTSKGVIGSRFSGIILYDDPHDDENSNTAEQRNKVSAFFKKTLLPCQVPNGISKAVVITTRWHEDDLAGRLIEETDRHDKPIWSVVQQQAIVQDEEGNLRSYWPEVWPLKAPEDPDDHRVSLEEKEDEVGYVIFQMMYMNSTSGKASGDYTLERLNTLTIDDDKVHAKSFAEVSISVDIAYSVQKRADWTVYTAIARTKERNFEVVVLDSVRFKTSKDTVKMQALKEFADLMLENWGRLDRIYFQKVAAETALSISLEDKHVDLPVENVATKGDKGSRLKAVTVLYDSGRLYFRRNMRNRMVFFGELIDFPGSHDDCVDTLSLVFQHPKWQRASRARAGTKRVHGPIM